jgi:hypothetical protein
MVSVRLKILLSVMLMLMVSNAACAKRSVPVVNYENQAIVGTSDKANSLEDIGKRVAAAAISKGWSLSGVEPGRVTATLVVRGKHTTVVDITYTEKTFSIKYKDSTNMLYDRDKDGNETIHTNYNRWVSSLLIAINKELLELK